MDEPLKKEGAFKPVSITDLEVERRSQVEERLRKKDKERLEKLKEEDMPRAVMQLNKFSPCSLEI